jgi:hypothetical protein
MLFPTSLILLLLKQIVSLNLEEMYLIQDLAIYDLTESTMPRFIEMKKICFILFYNTEDPQSKRPLLEFEKASKQGEKMGVSFGRIDTKFNKEIMSAYNVTHIPSVLWINHADNVKEEVNTFNYIGYAKRKFGKSSIDELNSIEELRKKNTTGNYLLIGLKDVSKADMDKINLLDSMAERVGFEFIYLMKNFAEMEKHYPIKTKGNMVLISNRYDNLNKTHESELIDIKDEDFKEDKLINLLELYTMPGFQTLNKDLFFLIQSGKPSMLFIYKDMSDKRFEKAETIMKELSQKYRRDLLFSISDFENPGIEVLKTLYNIKAEHLPFLLITKARESSALEMDKYKLENVKLSKKIFQNFISDWQDGKLKTFMVSQDADQEYPDKHGIYKVVGKNFNEFLSQKNKDLILLVCSNQTDYCTKFYERFKRMASKFKDNENLMLGQTDPTMNEYEVPIVHNFPNIFYMPANKKSFKERFNEAMIYEGDFTSLSVADWIVKSSDGKAIAKKLDDDEKLDEEEKKETIINSASDFNIEDLMKGDIDFDPSKVYKLDGDTVLDDELEKLEKMMSEGQMKKDPKKEL